MVTGGDGSPNAAAAAEDDDDAEKSAGRLCTRLEERSLELGVEEEGAVAAV